MKRILSILLIAVLALLSVSAQASTWYVATANKKTASLRDPATNAVVRNIPYGTALEVDDQRSNETSAYVTWGGKSGFVRRDQLSETPPADSAAAISDPNAAGQTQTMLPTAGSGAVTIQAIGAYLEYNSGKDKGKYSAISYDTPVKLRVTANVPKGRSIDYWVIDGVRYDFKSKVPTSFTIDKAADNMIVEPVLKGGTSLTLLSLDAIRQTRTGLKLIVDTIHAKLAHVRDDLKGAGGWLTEFDFTDDYQNRATKKTEEGGQVTVRVRASVPKGKTISYWKFDDVRLDFDKNVTEMVVHTLNVSKTYEPVFGSTKKTERDEPPAEDVYYNVTCIKCRFSGGGYSGATSGKVKAGTRITVTADCSGSGWKVNGSDVMEVHNRIVDGKKTPVKEYSTRASITREINKNTTIEALPPIN